MNDPRVRHRLNGCGDVLSATFAGNDKGVDALRWSMKRGSHNGNYGSEDKANRQALYLMASVVSLFEINWFSMNKIIKPRKLAVNMAKVNAHRFGAIQNVRLAHSRKRQNLYISDICNTF